MKPPASYSVNDYKSSKLDFNMEKIFYEDTVWVETVHLKENTKEFDLRKLTCRCFVLGPKLKEWRNEQKLTQNQVVEKLELAGRFQLMDFEKGKVGVPLNLLFKFVNLYKKEKEFENKLPQLYFSRNRNEIILPLAPGQIDKIIEFLKPIHRNVVKVSLRASEKELREIESIFKVRINYLKSLRTINSRALVDFLSTFYEYNKVCKLDFPLTKEVAELTKKGVDLRKAIIVPLLQSDGFASIKKGFEFTGKCRHMHDLFTDAMFYQYGIPPSGYFFDSDNDGSFKTFYVPNTKIYADLVGLGKAFKSCPNKGQSVSEFLKNAQPTLEYLFNSELGELVFAFRIYSSAEGCICHTGSCPKFEIACANPSLANDLVIIADKLGISLKISKGHTWSGTSSVVTNKIRDVELFEKMGGFMDKITVEGNSTYLKGVEKNKVLKVIVKHREKIRKNKTERPSKQVLDLINSTLSV
jgi:transcriptional regulator with XRE-family HTH domain